MAINESGSDLNSITIVSLHNLYLNKVADYILQFL